MRSDWKELPFEEAIDFQEGPGILAKDFHADGIPLVRLAGLSGTSVLDGCNYLDPAKVDAKWSHFRLLPGDVLLSTSASLGRIAIVGPEAEGAIAYTGLIRMRPRPAGAVACFIPYLLASEHFQRQVRAMGSGSVMNHFGPTHLRQMSVVLPPCGEQRRIAAVLGALDDKIEHLATITGRLQEVAAIELRNATSDASGTPTALAALVEVLRRGVGPKYSEDGILVLNQKCVRHGRVDFGLARRHDSAARSVAGRELAIGDVVINSTGVGTLGRTAAIRRLPEPVVVDSHVTVVRADPSRVVPEFLSHAIRSKEREIEALGEGSTGQTELSRKRLGTLDVSVPSVAIQERFAAVVRTIDSWIAAAEVETERLHAVRDELLPKLVSGRLRVAEEFNPDALSAGVA